MDRDGYGYRPEDRGIGRLMEDLRTLSPAGIERLAGGWRRLEEAGAVDRLHAAEKDAVHALEQADAAPAWEEARRLVLDLTEGRGSLVAWRAEHGEMGHRAERATLAAALALVAQGHVSGEDQRILVEAAAEALPWLLTTL